MNPMVKAAFETGDNQPGSLSALVGVRAESLKRRATDSTDTIHGISSQMQMLAINALIEATRAGVSGRGFGLIAEQVKAISAEIGQLARNLGETLRADVDALQQAAGDLTERSQSERMVDLALNAVELIDRNLYERTCDVRWWATDPALVACLTDRTPEASAYASERLAVILSSYTVYGDLWLVSPDGRIVANGRPDKHRVAGKSVTSEPWFRQGAALSSPDAFGVADIAACEPLGGAQVATYVAGVFDGRRSIGMLAIHFDWEPQARAIVEGVRIGDGDKASSRVMLLDAKHRVLASSDGNGALREIYPLRTGGAASGAYRTPEGVNVAFHLTPGYETYAGLGWYGVIERRPAG